MRRRAACCARWESKHDGCCPRQRRQLRTIRCMRSRSRIAAFSTATACSKRIAGCTAACGSRTCTLRRLALGCERLGIAAPDAAALRSDVQRLSGSAATRSAQDRRVARHRSARLSTIGACEDDCVSLRSIRPPPPSPGAARIALVRDAAGSQCAARRHQASQSTRAGARAGGDGMTRRSSTA